MERLKNTIARASDTFPEIIFYYLMILGASGFLFSWFEDKPLFESMWWACVTGLTIGYGDIYPTTVGGKIVAVALMHVVPLVIIPLIVARLLMSVVEDRHRFTHEEQEALVRDIHEIKKALGLTTGDGSNEENERKDQQ